MFSEYEGIEMMSIITQHSVFSLTDLTEIHFRDENVALNKQQAVCYHLVCLCIGMRFPVLFCICSVSFCALPLSFVPCVQNNR